MKKIDDIYKKIKGKYKNICDFGQDDINNILTDEMNLEKYNPNYIAERNKRNQKARENPDFFCREDYNEAEFDNLLIENRAKIEQENSEYEQELIRRRKEGTEKIKS